MSFDRAWLDLREPADRAARDPGLLAAAAAHAAGVAAPLIVDLGAGTGAMRRAFGDRLPPGTRWRLIDRDAGLLAAAAERGRPGVEAVVADLNAVAALPLRGARLVTASALVDLVSADWVEALAERLAAQRIGFYAALGYDGVMAWDPAMPLDSAVRDAFNAHQTGDKGFGPALGPAAAGAIAAAFARRGYAVETAASAWRLGPGDAALKAAFIAGVARAAAEAGLAAALAWGQARRAASGSSACTVGHADLLALPGGTKAQSKTTSVVSP